MSGHGHRPKPIIMGVGEDTQEAKGYVSICFRGLWLQRRGTDFRVYANTGYKPHPQDSNLLKEVFKRFFADDGVIPFSEIKVMPFELGMYVNRTVGLEDIKAEITAAAREAGHTVDLLPDPL